MDRHAESLAALNKEIKSLVHQMQHVTATVQQEQATHEQTRAALQLEANGRHTAETAGERPQGAPARE
jgi:hypothetical protein